MFIINTNVDKYAIADDKIVYVSLERIDYCDWAACGVDVGGWVIGHRKFSVVCAFDLTIEVTLPDIEAITSEIKSDMGETDVAFIGKWYDSVCERLFDFFTNRLPREKFAGWATISDDRSTIEVDVETLARQIKVEVDNNEKEA